MRVRGLVPPAGDAVQDGAVVMNPKVQAAGAAGAVTVVLVWAASLAKLEVPPEVASAVTVLISTAAGWIKTDKGGAG